MDLGVPGGGLRAVEAIRAGGRASARAVILALSGAELDALEPQLAAAGLDGGLSKPLKVGELRRHLDALAHVADSVR